MSHSRDSLVAAALGLAVLLAPSTLAALTARAPAPFPRKPARGMQTWIADLASPDGDKRVTATQAILKLGKDALPTLEKAGAKLIVPSHREKPSRLDSVYSVLKGWADNRPPPDHIFKGDGLYLFLARGWTKPEVIDLGRRVGFIVLIYEQHGWPGIEVRVDSKRKLAEVMKAILVTDPKVVSVNLVPAR